MIEIVLWIVVMLYAAFTLVLYRNWKKLPGNNNGITRHETTISVVIPVRNEAKNIGNLLNDLLNQTYPKQLYEVFIVDDASTDNTPEIVLLFQKEHPNLQLHLISLTDKTTLAPKKRAITEAVIRSTNDLIVATDGDCRVGVNWLLAYAKCYNQTGAKFISGPVTFLSEKQFSDYLQTVEFASLIGSGASAIQLGVPTMCNGANLAYERKLFGEVGGFNGVDQIASGDDEFLLHKIATKYPNGIQFLKSSDAIVHTEAHKTWQAFYKQRKRWASKWQFYKSKAPIVMAMFVFFANVSVIVTPIAWLMGGIGGYTAVGILALKWLPEWLFVGSVLSFLEKGSTRWAIPFVQLVYPFYVTLFGLVGQKGDYEWKGRTLR